MPLSLLTWVLVFARRPIFSQAFMLQAMPFAIAGIVALLLFSGRGSLLNTLFAHLLALFVIAMACHGELAQPASAGAPDGVLSFAIVRRHGRRIVRRFGGTQCIFLGSGISNLGRAGGVVPPFGAARDGLVARWFWPAAALLTAALLGPAIFGWHAGAAVCAPLYIAILSLAGISVVLALRSAPLTSASMVALAFALIRLYAFNEVHSETLQFLRRQRSVRDPRPPFPRAQARLHDPRRAEAADQGGLPVAGRPEPLTYYHRGSGMAAVIEAVRAQGGAAACRGNRPRHRVARLLHPATRDLLTRL